MHHHLAEMLASVIIAGIAAQWLGWRLRVPALILLIAFGLLLGPATGWLDPTADFGALLQPMVSLSVAVILFEGGLNLKWHELRSHSGVITRLVTWNVLLTFLLGTAAAYWLVDMSWPVALTFGAIIVITGPTVIMPMLRQANLKQRPSALLRWEGIVNDPVGAVLVVLIFGYYTYADADLLAVEIFSGLGISIIAALVLGVGSGLLLAKSFYAGAVPEHLKFPIVLVTVLVIYVIANRIQSEAGLLATTALGITLTNQRISELPEMKRFKEYMTIILVSATFIVLTADIQPEILERVGWAGWGLIALVVFLIRPLSIYLSTIGSKIEPGERLLLGWIAPRGIVAAAVAGLFGSDLAARGYAGAELLLPLIFSLIVITVVLHGLTIGPLGRRLGLASLSRDGVMLVGASRWSTALAEALDRASVPILLVDTRWNALREARMKNLPVHYGEVLSERTEEVLELAHITRLLAITPNEAYNSLVCRIFGPELGYQNVHELSWSAIAGNDAKRPARTVRGRPLFDDTLHFEDLEERIVNGWTFQYTPLTEKFTVKDAIETKPDEVVRIAAFDGEGGLFFHPWEERIDAGEIRGVMLLVPPSG